MLQIRRSSERGHLDHGWLNTYHTFSFADYFDSRHMGFRSLRVMNEDRVAAGSGFGMHGHRDMEILSYVLSGQLQHRDSLGNGSILQANEWQRITAGSGILHSEFNPSSQEPVHFYQIWLLPRQKGLKPGYEQKWFDPTERQQGWQQIASPQGSDHSLKIEQDVGVNLTQLQAGQERSWSIPQDRHIWLQVIYGTIRVQDVSLQTSDGLAVTKEDSLRIQANEPSEVLLFDLA